MDIKNVLTYLKEELKDIPASPDNIHYTDFEGLYYILQSGLKGQKGGYNVRTSKTYDDDMELATVRNSHKLSEKERQSLSQGAAGKVKINLFTDRILAGHRGTRKALIAELPIQRDYNIYKAEKDFKEKYGVEIPKFVNKNSEKFSNVHYDDQSEEKVLIKNWLRDHLPEYVKNASIINDIYYYNRDWVHYYKELRDREREERFILKKNIPVNPDFMEIIIEGPPLLNTNDDDFCQEVSKNYLKLLDRYKDVFVDNQGFRLFKNYLRKI